MTRPFDAALRNRVRAPILIALGSPAEAAELAGEFPGQDLACYQMDLYQAERLQNELASRGVRALVTTTADLWDLPATFQTVIYPAPKGGERALKLDVVEQAFHVLRPHGTLLVRSPYENDSLFPQALKKIFGRYHEAPVQGELATFWSQRQGERRRRRHEITFQVRLDEARSLRFLSRPGVFSYGRFDDGARALVDTMVVRAGERILDVGCGCGTNGLIAGLRGGVGCHVTFVDSNVRALGLTELNARANGLRDFQVVASSRVEVPGDGYDVALANPPYYAAQSIAQLFVERCRILLRPEGRFYLVTKQPRQIEPFVVEQFGRCQADLRRGYTILSARRR